MRNLIQLTKKNPSVKCQPTKTWLWLSWKYPPKQDAIVTTMDYEPFLGPY